MIRIDFTPGELVEVMGIVADHFEGLQAMDWHRRPDFERSSNLLETALNKLQAADSER